MRKPRGFSLIELLVVVAIIAALLAILTPSMGGARDSARLAVCGSNQRQVALAALYYTHSNRGYLPPTTTHRNSAQYWLTWPNAVNYGPTTVYPNAPAPWTQPDGRKLRTWLGNNLKQPDILLCPLGPPLEDPDYTQRYFEDEVMFSSFALLWGFESADAGGRFTGPRRLGDQLTGGGLLTADFTFEYLTTNPPFVYGMYASHTTPRSSPFGGLYWVYPDATAADWPANTPYNAAALDGSVTRYRGSDLQFVTHVSPTVVATGYPRVYVDRP